MSTAVNVCFTATCLILIVQTTSAWEPKPCEGSKGELISLELKNCPNTTGEYCEHKADDPVIYKIKFKSGELAG